MATKGVDDASARIDLYIAKAAPFAQPILWDLREVVHQAVPDVEEAVKWSMPFFVYQGIILAHMAAFKAHCSLGIWKENLVMAKNQTADDRDTGMGNFGKLTSLKDLPSDKELKAILKEAARKIAAGERIKNWERPAKRAPAEVEVPEALATALARNKAAAKVFDSMAAGCRRDYCDWITEAKREETRDKRVATAVEWIAEGKQRHWKYQNC